MLLACFLKHPMNAVLKYFLNDCSIRELPIAVCIYPLTALLENVNELSFRLPPKMLALYWLNTLDFRI